MMKNLLCAAVFGVLAVCINEFLVMVGISHPWSSWFVGMVVACSSFVMLERVRP